MKVVTNGVIGGIITGLAQFFMSNKANDNTIKNKLPKHVTITCDGNRRWAKKRHLPQMQGHKKGVDNLEHLIDAAREIGIEYLTCWVLSTENREQRLSEFEYMMELARGVTERYKKKCIDEKIRFVHLGRKDRLPEDILEHIKEMEEKTKDFDSFTFCLALDYGGRDELMRAIKKLNDQGLEVTEENISNCLDTAGLPDPDLMIRTGAQIRLSGIMPWAGTYSELYFTDVLFPSFNKDELQKAVDFFAGVKRNFGK